MSEVVYQVKMALKEKANPIKAAFFPRFFKTGPGEYGEGDQFYGVIVPEQRKIAKAFFKEISLEDLSLLMKDPIHEVRLTSLFALVYKYQKEKTKEQKKVFVDFYLGHLDWVNNWDLVDSSCHHILGEYYLERDKSLFFQLAESGHLWRERIAMISSYYWIKRGQFEDALSLAEKFLQHPHDLMHKAVGWMLREIGKMDYEVEYQFLKKHYPKMPRTALRYAIEKFDEEIRQDFLKNRI